MADENFSIQEIKAAADYAGWVFEKNKKDKLHDDLIEGMAIAAEIKAKSSPGDSGEYDCRCGKKLKYEIHSNGHLLAKCTHCQLVIME